MARGSLLAIVAIAGGVPIALMLWVRTSYATGQHAAVAQPIPFDHRVHAHALQVDCRYCHATAQTAASAGLPPTAACVGCHTTAMMQSSVMAPVRASLASEHAVQWQRVDALPDFVYFDHSIHLAKGVGCETCHGRVDEMSQVRQATPMSMNWCVSCHRDPVRAIRPRTELTAMGWDAAHQGRAADLARESLARAYHVQSLTDCTTCHR